MRKFLQNVQKLCITSLLLCIRAESFRVDLVKLKFTLYFTIMQPFYIINPFKKIKIISIVVYCKLLLRLFKIS